jgi:hypothetical protein
MKKILTVLGVLALAGGNALAADKILKGDQFVVAGVNFPQPFQTLSGQVLKAGVYDLKVVSDGTEAVLIGLLKEGKQFGQLRGTVHFVNFGGLRQGPGGLGKALPVDQGIKLQPTPKEATAGSGTPAGIMGPVDNKAFRDFGFTPASRVSFGGGAGKISSSGNVQPGGASLPYIEFPLPPAAPKTK